MTRPTITPEQAREACKSLNDIRRYMADVDDFFFCNRDGEVLVTLLSQAARALGFKLTKIENGKK